MNSASATSASISSHRSGLWQRIQLKHHVNGKRNSRIYKHLSKLVVVLCFSAPLVFALNGRSWVSSTGSDSNPCTRSMPCATFQTAIGQTNSGGEVDVIDPGDYGTVHLFFPITIDGGGMARISIGSNIFGVNVSQTVSGPIIVRNLSIMGSTGSAFTNAFFMGQCGLCVSAYEVHVENLDIANVGEAFDMQDVGIVSIKGSTILRRGWWNECVLRRHRRHPTGHQC